VILVFLFLAWAIVAALTTNALDYHADKLLDGRHCAEQH
jgi:hypothetical protein